MLIYSVIDKIKDVKNDEAQTTRNRIVYVTTILLVLSFAVTSLMSVFSIDKIINSENRNMAELLANNIKKSVNESIGQRKTKKAYDVISDSHIICVFGMSIGNTDKMWWEYIVKWLIENERNKLIIFWCVDESYLRKKLPAKIIRLNNQIKRMVFEKGQASYDDAFYNKVKARIMISYNASIFSFPIDEEIDD